MKKLLWILLVVVILVGAYCLYVNNWFGQSTSTIDEHGQPIPVITSITPTRGSVGETVVEIKGSNFSGFESDVIFWIENEKGERGVLFTDNTANVPDLDSKVIVPILDRVCMEVTIYSGKPCEKYMTITPGTYRIYTSPWGTNSNKVTFSVI